MVSGRLERPGEVQVSDDVIRFEVGPLAVGLDRGSGRTGRVGPVSVGGEHLGGRVRGPERWAGAADGPRRLTAETSGDSVWTADSSSDAARRGR